MLRHPSVRVSAGYVTKLLKEEVITSVLTPPSILEDVSRDPAWINEWAKLTHIGYGGGPLQPSVSSFTVLKASAICNNI